MVNKFWIRLSCRCLYQNSPDHPQLLSGPFSFLSHSLTPEIRAPGCSCSSANTDLDHTHSSWSLTTASSLSLTHFACHFASVSHLGCPLLDWALLLSLRPFSESQVLPLIILALPLNQNQALAQSQTCRKQYCLDAAQCTEMLTGVSRQEGEAISPGNRTVRSFAASLLAEHLSVSANWTWSNAEDRLRTAYTRGL